MKLINFTKNIELWKMIERSFPIKTKNIDHIIDRVADQYPFVERQLISSVIHAFFSIMRNQLMKGKIVHFTKYIPQLGILTYMHGKNIAIRPKIRTPKSFRVDSNE